MGKFLGGLLALLLIIILGSVVFEKTYFYPSRITYGVTFSSRYARYLNLDWEKTYIQMLDDLKVKNLRIPSYWDILQPQPQVYDFSETDYLLNEAGKRDAKVILVVGARQPRWPECHIPAWAKSLSVGDRQQRILQFIQKTVERYKNHPAVWAWQVENEPFLPFFGEGCDPIDEGFLRTEVNLVRSISHKTIIVSDSGELGSWIVPMQISDIFGTTLYRDVYNPVMGYFSYPVLPYLYNIKSQIGRIFAPGNLKTIIIELQTEPWLSPENSKKGTPLRQTEIFSLGNFNSNIAYAKKTGFDEVYLWGLEWWYFMAQQGYPQYLDFARTLFR